MPDVLPGALPQLMYWPSCGGCCRSACMHARTHACHSNKASPPHHVLFIVLLGSWARPLPADEANVETHGFDPALCNNHLNPACSPLWLNAIVGEQQKAAEHVPGCVMHTALPKMLPLAHVHASWQMLQPRPSLLPVPCLQTAACACASATRTIQPSCCGHWAMSQVGCEWVAPQQCAKHCDLC